MTAPVELNADQQRALNEILAARKPNHHHCLTGFAGTGKTTLMQHVAQIFTADGLEVVMTAPTHKAVAVLRRKLQECGLSSVGCCTIHTLLSLKPKVQRDRMLFLREKHAKPVTAAVVVIDECSMVGQDLMDHISRHLRNAFVLFVGDPAQLPPVNEVASKSFDTPSRSHLDTIIRQAAGNPILNAATAIRMSQGGPMDWSWVKSDTAPPLGVYRPGRSADAWLEKAFTSAEFEKDPDTFRYLAWTNARVAEVNAKVRRWRYGDNIPAPFVPGERALMRAPVVKDEEIILNTNEEAKVLSIDEAHFAATIESTVEHAEWVAEIPSWHVTLERDSGDKVSVFMPSDDAVYNHVIDRIKDEANWSPIRWKHLHEFRSSMARMQSIYAMTIHTSQGSTFSRAFLDIPDVRRRASTNVLETQQLLYVAATRPSQALMLVGA